MNMLNYFKKYFGKKPGQSDEIEKAKEIIDRFANGELFADSEIISVANQIKNNSPDDTIIKLLKDLGRVAEFKEYAIKITGRNFEKEELRDFFLHTNKTMIMGLNNRFHQNRNATLSDNLYSELRKLNERIENSIEYLKFPETDYSKSFKEDFYKTVIDMHLFPFTVKVKSDF